MQQTIKQLISPEILLEIQTSFSKKYGVAVGVFDLSLQPQLLFPRSVPGLDNLPSKQKKLFELFFDPASFDVRPALGEKQHLVQSFGDNTVCRAIFPIHFAEVLMGWLVILQFVKPLDSARDEHFLYTLAQVAQKDAPLRSLQDHGAATGTNNIKLYGQELLSILQLFLEAGLARAHVSREQPASQIEEPADSKNKIGILFCAPNGNILDAILHVSEFLGYRIGDLADLNFFHDVLATNYDREKIRLLLQQGTSSQSSAELMAKSGAHVTVDIQLSIQRAATDIIGFECHVSPQDRQPLQIEKVNMPADDFIFYDDQRLAELQAIYEPLQRELGALVMRLVHKLAQFYEIEVENLHVKKQVTEIRQLCSRLSSLADQLRLFAQTKAPNRTQTNLNGLMKHVSGQIARLLPKKISLKVKLGGRVAAVKINQEQLVHAVGCLCKNAVEAMPEGGVLSVETETFAEREDWQTAAIHIKDTGTGFPEANREHFLEPFVTTKKKPGAGLGLSTVYGIVKSHDGRLSIKSESGGGTTVSIYLPIFRPSNQIAEEEEATAAAVRGHILLIDDERDLAEATAMTLRREGYAVFTSSSCDDAFAIYNKIGEKIDLIILDNQLVGTTGVNCAQNLIKKSPKTPILFYSGADDDLELRAFIKNIGAGWLKKPFGSQELLSHVNSLISRT